MKDLYTRTAWLDMIPMLFIGGFSVAGTWICSDLQGNEVYTDHNGPRCREFPPTNPDAIPKQSSAKTPMAPKHTSKHAPIPFSSQGPSYSEQDLLRAVASGNKRKTELGLQAGISANAKDEQGQSA